jgi:hypothetical protein
LATTSQKIVVEINGVPTILEIDANLWGTGTVAQRPASGDNVGDIYIVQDPPLYRFDVWNGASWVAATIVGPSGGSVDNRAARWDGTSGSQLQNSLIGITDDGSIQLNELAGDPSSPVDGEIWYNTTADKLYARVGGKTKVLAAGSSFDNVKTVDASNPNADYSTIGAAVSAASDGDVILVGPGDYNETGITITKEVAIIGLAPTTYGAQTPGPYVRIYGTLSSSGSILSRDPTCVEIVLANIWLDLTWTGSSGTGYCIDGSAAEWRIDNCYVRVTVSTGAGASSNVYGVSFQRAQIHNSDFIIQDSSTLITSGFKRPVRHAQFAPVDTLYFTHSRIWSGANAPGDLYVSDAFTNAKTRLNGSMVEGTLNNADNADIFLDGACCIAAFSGDMPQPQYHSLHDNIEGEINALTDKASPVGADVLVIEDSAASYTKKKVSITNLPGGSDADAIHDNVSGEINAITDKASPVGADILLIEDSDASYAKKKVSITNLPGGADADAIHYNVADEYDSAPVKADLAKTDLLLLEDSAATWVKKSFNISSIWKEHKTDNLKYVDKTNPAADYTTISSAVSAASSGDVIVVGPGTYTESISIPASKNLIIIGDSDDPSRVIITSTKTATGDTILQGGAASLYLANLTVKVVSNASTGTVCAVRWGNYMGKLTMRNVVVEGSTGGSAGATSHLFALMVEDTTDGNVEANFCTFQLNDADPDITAHIDKTTVRLIHANSRAELNHCKVLSGTNTEGNLITKNESDSGVLAIATLANTEIENNIDTASQSGRIFFNAPCVVGATNSPCEHSWFQNGQTLVTFTGFSVSATTSSTSVDWTNGQKCHLGLSSTTTISFTAPGQTWEKCNLLMKISHVSAGNSITWPSSVKWPGGTAPTLSTGINDVDIISFYFDGTNYYGVASLDFS